MPNCLETLQLNMNFIIKYLRTNSLTTKSLQSDFLWQCNEQVSFDHSIIVHFSVYPAKMTFNFISCNLVNEWKSKQLVWHWSVLIGSWKTFDAKISSVTLLFAVWNECLEDLSACILWQTGFHPSKPEKVINSVLKLACHLYFFNLNLTEKLHTIKTIV